MSAFVVNNGHVSAIVRAALKLNYGATWWHEGEQRELRRGDQDGAERIARVLMDENVRSVAHRYDEPPENTDDFRFAVTGRTPTPVEALKLIRCLDYQSCEHPEWKTSEAKAFLDALTRALITHLPGYDDAAWEFDARAVAS